MRDLRLYERAEAVFNQDAELHETHQRRQADLRRLQELYRVRLSHEKAAARELFAMNDDSEPMRSARRAALSAIRRLDAEHLKAIRRIHLRWDSQLGIRTRPVLARQLAELEHLVEKARVVCLAGGHVAVLLNRLRLFGLERLLRTRPVVAWSAGAMAVSERIVLSTTTRRRAPGMRSCSRQGLAWCVAPYSCPTPRRVSRSATATACRCSRAG